LTFVADVFTEAFRLLLVSSPYMIFGLVVSGFLRVFLNPDAVARHLGRGRFVSVLKASLLGVPMPLCSCGVLPAAVSLRKQGANRGATTAFLISTPESGVDSMAITYALLDPIMTVARPVAALFTALAAGIAENLLEKEHDRPLKPDLTCPVDACCDGESCSPKAHARHHTFIEKVRAGLAFSFTEVWEDLAAWFLFGLLLAGLISVIVPQDLIIRYLGGGVGSMLVMLAAGIPIYICATASTPIAAALILKGVSPGAALVFLLAGPATNITSLTVLFGVLGKRATAIYLSTISVMAVIFGLVVDRVYASLDLSAAALAGRTAEAMPVWVEWACAIVLIILSIGPVYAKLRVKMSSIAFRLRKRDAGTMDEGATPPPVPCKGPT